MGVNYVISRMYTYMEYIYIYIHAYRRLIGVIQGYSIGKKRGSPQVLRELEDAEPSVGLSWLGDHAALRAVETPAGLTGGLWEIWEYN